MAEAKALQFRAKHRYARMTARKARPVLNMIRGLDVNRAIEMLNFENRRAAHAARKVLRSALANAETMIQDRRLEIDPEDLLITDARADVGPSLKRWLPRARGMATPILKRTCHISITLAPKPVSAPVPEPVVEGQEAPASKGTEEVEAQPTPKKKTQPSKKPAKISDTKKGPEGETSGS
ncbi:MAG: 50S ribosomal protein L22 [Planctomycetota bacterium]|nr:50S ribosomal protein L22 [Planctomycetota bacterium]